MSFELFKTCLDKVPENVRIDFSGMAEPWLNKRCTDMILYAQQSGFELVVYTTLVGMEIEDIERISAVPFKHFEIHLPDADSLTQITVNNEYLRKVDKILSSGISGLSFMTIGNLHSRLKKIVGLDCSENEVISRAGNLTNFPGMNLQKRLSGIIYCDSCGSDFNHNVLLPNGDIIVCCMDYAMQYVIGNLTETNYADLFQSTIISEMRKKLIDDRDDIFCRYCHNASRSRLNWLPGARKLLRIFN
ncbi:SPASM domain-containing protein [Desulfobacterota bacterium M19]